MRDRLAITQPRAPLSDHHKATTAERLTKSLRRWSGTFLVELQICWADEWENITGASLTDSASLAVAAEE